MKQDAVRGRAGFQPRRKRRSRPPHHFALRAAGWNQPLAARNVGFLLVASTGTVETVPFHF